MTTNNTKKTKFLEPFQPFVGKLVKWECENPRILWPSSNVCEHLQSGELRFGDLFAILSLEHIDIVEDGGVSNLLILHPLFGIVFVDVVLPDYLSIVSTTDEESE